MFVIPPVWTKRLVYDLKFIVLSQEKYQIMRDVFQEPCGSKGEEFIPASAAWKEQVMIDCYPLDRTLVY